MSQIKVAVSPHYRGSGWTDRSTGIKFEQQSLHLRVHTIDTEGKDLSGIKNSLRLNHLLLLEGKVPSNTADRPSKINPEELTGEELDDLLKDGGSSSEELDALKEENKSLKEKVSDLEKLLDEVEKEMSELKENQGSSEESPEITKNYLDKNFTKAELVKMAKEENVDHDASINKKDLVELLVKELNEAK